MPVYLNGGNGRVERDGDRIVVRESVLSRYAERMAFYEGYSLYQYASEVDKGERSVSGTVIPRLIPHREYGAGPKDPEQYRLYCRDMLIAFKPWRGDVTSLLPEGSSWEAEFDTFVDSGLAALQLLRELERAGVGRQDELEGGVVGRGDPADNSDTESSEIDLAASQLASQDSYLASNQRAVAMDWIEAVAPPVGFGGDGADHQDLLDALDYGGDDYPWDEYSRSNPAYHELRNFESVLLNEQTSRSAAQARPSPLELHGEQRLVFAMVFEHFQQVSRGVPQEQLLLIVSGTAGTGKSKIIHCLRAHLGDACRVVAPSGVAAFNVSGLTIHALLKLPINLRASDTLEPLAGDALREAQSVLNGVTYLLIDERSFVGQRMLSLVSARLSQIVPHGDSLPFGGLSVVLFGDDAQLPPVRDTPLYMKPRAGDWASVVGSALYRQFRHCVVLRTVFRQTEDRFRGCLMRVRDAAVTDDDVQLLQSRVLRPDALPAFENAPRIFATRRLVDACNLSMLAQPRPALHGAGVAAAVAIIAATDVGPTRTAFTDDVPPRHLLLKEGARVMLRRNLSVQHGLVNGALGTVVNIVYEPGRRPPNDTPFCILVQFDTYSGPSCDPRHGDRVVPIFPVRTQGAGGAARVQFPLTLAWAMTVHKFADALDVPPVAP